MIPMGNRWSCMSCKDLWFLKSKLGPLRWNGSMQLFYYKAGAPMGQIRHQNYNGCLKDELQLNVWIV
ncbi:MAG: hypothetical protein JWP81_5229 [Ferruginibacter sp.]|nr:hypothetical protein [Ferruginibacter sp.]